MGKKLSKQLKDQVIAQIRQTTGREPKDAKASAVAAIIADLTLLQISSIVQSAMSERSVQSILRNSRAADDR